MTPEKSKRKKLVAIQGKSVVKSKSSFTNESLSLGIVSSHLKRYLAQSR